MATPEIHDFLKKVGDFFDESFDPISVNNHGDKLLGLELLMKFPDREGSYLLQVESLPLYIDRSESNDDISEEGENSAIYTVAQEELLPGDLLQIKAKSYEELEKFLILQSEES